MEKEEEILDYLGSRNTMSLATVGEGKPHASTVFYVNRGFVLYFLSSPLSRHGVHLAVNPRVAVTIDEDYRNWREIKGIQMEAFVRPLGPIWDNILLTETFARKFPGVRDILLSPAELSPSLLKKITGVIFYELIPERIFFLDNSVAFGHREEIFLANGVPVRQKPPTRPSP